MVCCKKEAPWAALASVATALSIAEGLAVEASSRELAMPRKSPHAAMRAERRMDAAHATVLAESDLATLSAAGDVPQREPMEQRAAM